MRPHPKQYNRLLITEPPLQVLPSLATLIGLNDAIVLQQLHYWLQSKSAKDRDGRAWIYNTYEDWHRQMPFWSERTIQRIALGLVEQGLVVTTQQYNSSKMDKTNWYSLDYEELARRTDSDDHDDNLSSSGRQVDTMDDDSLATSVPETTQETTVREKRTMTLEELEEHERQYAEAMKRINPLRPQGWGQ